MKLSVIVHTSDYRGDHSADIAVAHEVRPGETVESLAARLLGPQRRHVDWYAQRIEIRPVVPPEGDSAEEG